MSCAPFSLRLDIVQARTQEDFLACPVLSLPDSFSQSSVESTGDIMDAAGALYFRREVLIDAVVPRHESSFELTTESYVRVYAQQHRIDIDLQIKNANTGAVVAHGYRTTGPEIIMSKLPAGRYTFVLISFSQSQIITCDSLMLEVAIAPVTSAPSFCNGVTVPAYPSFTGLSGVSAPAAEFHLAAIPAMPYAWVFNGDHSQTTVISQ
jgi:hypothetical protein